MKEESQTKALPKLDGLSGFITIRKNEEMWRKDSLGQYIILIIKNCFFSVLPRQRVIGRHGQ